MELLKPGLLMEIIPYGTQSVSSGLVVMSVQFEVVPALENCIVLKLSEHPHSEHQHRPLEQKAAKSMVET